MQLRAARLCLDCEELFVGESCPVCASERYAFLANWIPVEERRRLWRRATGAAAPTVPGRLAAIRRFFAELFGDGEPIRPSGPPRTRASDHVPQLDFEGRLASRSPQAASEPHPLKGDAR